jgi:hypothetical protein
MQIKINMIVIRNFYLKARSVSIVISCLSSEKCSIMESQQTWLLLFLIGSLLCLTWVCTSKQKVLHSIYHVFMYVWLKSEVWNSFSTVMYIILLTSSTNFQFSIPSKWSPWILQYLTIVINWVSSFFTWNRQYFFSGEF